MRPVSLWAGFGLALFAVTALGCGRTVTVQPPGDIASAERCQALKEDLPDTFAGERRLSVNPDSAQTAAWGSPAIVWRCGVVTDAADPNSQLIEVNGTTWQPEELESGVRFTTVGQAPRIELTVPSIYPSPAGLLARLSG